MRDSPTVRAALKAVSQGVAVASPQMQFHLLDAAIFCGQVEAVVKLMSNQSGPVRRNMSQHLGSTPYMTTLLSTSVKNGFSEEDTMRGKGKTLKIQNTAVYARDDLLLGKHRKIEDVIVVTEEDTGGHA